MSVPAVCDAPYNDPERGADAGSSAATRTLGLPDPTHKLVRCTHEAECSLRPRIPCLSVRVHCISARAGLGLAPAGKFSKIADATATHDGPG